MVDFFPLSIPITKYGNKIAILACVEISVPSIVYRLGTFIKLLAVGFPYQGKEYKQMVSLDATKHG